MSENRDHFTFFRSFREQIDLCDEKDQLRLYRAITDFALFHNDTTFSEPLLNMAWIGMKPHLEKSWIKYTNASKSKGVPKPSMKGNKNAVKEGEQGSEERENKANSMLNQSENKTIGMECNGMDSIDDVSSSSIGDEDVDWIKFADEWKKNSWRVEKNSPLVDLQYSKVSESQKQIVKQRIADCMNEYNVTKEKAKDMVFRVIRNAGNTTNKNYLRTDNFRSSVNFDWLFSNSRNFFAVLSGDYLNEK